MDLQVLNTKSIRVTRQLLLVVRMNEVWLYSTYRLVNKHVVNQDERRPAGLIRGAVVGIVSPELSLLINYSPESELARMVCRPELARHVKQGEASPP